MPLPRKFFSKPTPLLHIHHLLLEAVLERPHIGIDALVELERIWNDLDEHILQRTLLTVLVAQEEEAWMLRVYAESVHRTLWIRFGVGRKPLICQTNISIC